MFHVFELWGNNTAGAHISSVTVSGLSTASSWQWTHCCTWTSIWLVNTFFHSVPATFHPATWCFWLVNALFFRCPTTFCMCNLSNPPLPLFFWTTSEFIGLVEDGSSYLCNIATSIAPFVTRLFNLSIQSGKVPAEWKQFLVVPIPKSSDLSSPNNYRPISLLSILSKLLERHIQCS